MPQHSRSKNVRYVAPRKRPSALLGALSFLTRRRSPSAQPDAPSRRGAGAAKPSSGSKSLPSLPTLPGGGISPERKMDIAGVLLAGVGVISFFSLFATKGEGLGGAWMTFLRGMFGLGAFFLPLGLSGVGVWMALRSSSRLPHLALERLVGILLLYTNFITWLYYLQNLLRASFEGADVVQNLDNALAYDVVSHSGGYLGGLLGYLLLLGLGAWGAAIVLFAWFVIALTMSLDVSVPELFAWLAPFWAAARTKQQRLTQALADLTHRRAATPPVTPNRAAPAPSAAGMDARAALTSPSLMTPAAEEAQPAQAWVLPGIDQILEQAPAAPQEGETDGKRVAIIEETLASFSAPGHVIEISRGPTITQFGVEPDFVETRRGRMRVRVGKIAALAADLALALAAKRIRIQAPVPGKGYIGIEVPNEHPALVSLRGVVESAAFQRLKSSLRFALGQNVSGEAVSVDLSAMPHLLIAGATGSGKSVCVNAIISCLLLHNTPDTLRLLMVDPKRVELTGYNGIPHLLAPVVVELKQVVGALQWVTREMDRRYHLFSDLGVRNIADYNRNAAAPAAAANGSPAAQKPLPYLVVIIDELADLMMLAPDETERSITRLAQLARATGIHLILATQRPSVDVVTGVIKANFPARIAFTVASSVDSRVIIDQPGAERLLGNGDMLFQAPDAPAPLRLQGVFVSDAEIQRLVGYWRGFALQGSPPVAAGGMVDSVPAGAPLKQLTFLEGEQEDEQDPLYKEAVELARRQGRASVSMLQRRLRIGYTRAARLVEAMETHGIVAPPTPETGTRDVLDYGEAAAPVDE